MIDKFVKIFLNFILSFLKFSVTLYRTNEMKKTVFLAIAAGLILLSCRSWGSSLLSGDDTIKLKKVHRIIYFNPEVFPNYEGIREPTNKAFFNTVTNELRQYGDYKILRVDTPIAYDSVDVQSIKDYCKFNNAEVAVVPKVKYFKVGIGKYVFSNQVIISMKLYNSNGELVMENSFDTYKGKGRLLGSAENSVNIGTSNVIRNLVAALKSRNKLTAQQ